MRIDFAIAVALPEAVHCNTRVCSAYRLVNCSSIDAYQCAKRHDETPLAAINVPMHCDGNHGVYIEARMVEQ